MSFIRYPGGKSRFKDQILSHLKNVEYTEYREPFFGGGSIGLEILKRNKIKKFWINDKDFGIYCLWKSVKDNPTELIDFVKNLIPSVEKFDEFKNALLSNSEANHVKVGFMKLAIHQMSFSGLGLKSGGPLGGRKQDEHTKYGIGCRWSSDYICKKINFYSDMMNNVDFKITNDDFVVMIDKEPLIYLDPPYFDKGADLYLHSFKVDDHERMAEALKTADNWILSYDDCPEIRKLYDWAHIEEFSGKYTIKQRKDDAEWNSTKKTELLIMPAKTEVKVDDLWSSFFVE